ncbi:diguanylate cyclase [Bacillus sp. JJ1609]|uniref:GGDEF domain-containing response regulator n=1 Tax=Bacillus sp. JJ1609 TaxID=3122977 RepID=UPI002FFE1C43
MALEKYQKLLFEKIKKQISQWFDTNPNELVEYEEVYRFLHSIKGTSGTVQLGGLLIVASKLLAQLESIEEHPWIKNELRDFLFELIRLSYDYEHFNDPAVEKDEPCCGSVPLIQIIDDDVSMLILLKEALEEKGWMVITNTEPEKAVSQYYDLQPDCLVLDVDLPSKNGFQLLEDIQQHNHKQFIPKVITSIQKDRKTRMNAYEMGADDFIEKPIDIEEFIIRINRQLQRKQIFDQSVLIDELTQVYNRRFLFDLLERYIKDYERTDVPFSVSLLDLDYFKNINDRYGHLTGDKVLEVFASYLKENIRSTDIVFRYGGEEFVILFPRTTAEESKEVVKRILEEFSKVIFIEHGESFNISFSAGIYMVNNHEEGSLEILKMADQALYEAKENGRACVESANETVQPENKVLNVSVIDDDAIIRTLLVRVLQNMDTSKVLLNIESYENGEKFFGAGRLDEKGKHFLVLDGVMPVMDGIEVLTRVRESEHADRAHVLMLTGRKTEYDIARALKLGADDYVTKPFSITELQARIQRLIQRMF